MTKRSATRPARPAATPDDQYPDRETRRRHELLGAQIAEATRQRDALRAEVRDLERARDLAVEAGASALAELAASRQTMATVGQALDRARAAVAAAQAEEAAVRDRLADLEHRAAAAEHRLLVAETATEALTTPADPDPGGLDREDPR